MVCIVLSGIRICIDFTAPFLLGILSLTLPAYQIWQTVSACLLHEAAHIIVVFCTSQRPEKLTVSACGMQLTIRRGTLCPLRSCIPILLSGPLANLVAALVLLHFGLHEAAAANLSLFWFNLLPFCGTDGGTLLRMVLEQKYEPRKEIADHIAQCTALAAALTILALIHITEQRNPVLFVLIIYLTLSDFM